MRWSQIGCAAVVWAMIAARSFAVYTNIVVDGLYDDWSGVPVVASDVSGDNDTGPDLATLQVANDASNLYLRVTYHADVNPNAGPSVLVALDNDVNLGTGFDVFGLGLVGSDAGWQNDFPFQQAAGNFNSGTVSGGGAAIAPYNTVTTAQEYAIPLTALFDAGGLPVFPDDTFRLMIYTDPTAANETMGPVTYTLSVAVEEAEFSTISRTDVMSFLVTNSQAGLSYRLEYGDTPSTTNWLYTGYTVEGNGGPLYLFDATGFSTTKVYRILSIE
mgnify:CR=1 FL=1